MVVEIPDDVEDYIIAGITKDHKEMFARASTKSGNALLPENAVIILVETFLKICEELEMSDLDALSYISKLILLKKSENKEVH